MATDEAVLARLDDLIGRASALTNNSGQQAYYPLLVQVKTAVSAIAGDDSDYYRLLDQRLVTVPHGYGLGGMTIAQALTNLRSDVENGYLRRQADLIAAEVFGNFLDMAEHLLDAGYYQPAASLIGAVLEDGLRRLARNADVGVKPGDDISSLNNRLAAKAVYTNLVRKQVDVWGAVRNHADHGEFDKISEADVRDMYSGVTRFMAEKLG
ncbi:MAG: hypothetical protein Q8P61_08705 [Candidatus Nanopelagicales bacterium]|nr:hypothetical protein [Candidatus Nanopelagicales bacterium]